jgi:hypothetical protein
MHNVSIFPDSKIPKSIHYEKRVMNMAENVLRIEAKRYREDSVVMSARIPKDMLQDIDFVAKESGRTRNEIVTMFLDFALKNTEIIDKQ